MADATGSLQRPYIFRDPVHGDIMFARDGLHTLVREIVDDEAFQRLRSIKQNGVLNLVFHGAEHSRFTHSLGAAHLAGRMYDAACRNSSLTPSAEERKLTVLAALLHDVGHGPFSHLLEEVLGKKHFHHETMTARLLTEDGSSICAHLRAHDPELPEKLLPFVDYKKRVQSHWYYALVSSQLDADRLDYTARDAMMAGVVSHRFDRDRLIGALYVWKSGTSADGAGEDLAVDDRAFDVVENYLFALHHLYRSIYFHHTVRAASWLLNAAIRRARTLARQDEKRRAELFPALGGERDPLWALIEDGSKVPLSTYTRLDEPHVWGLVQRWRSAADPTLQDLCNRLKQRRYLKAMDISSNFDEGVLLLDEAKSRTRAVHPELDLDLYVHIDRIGRETYRPYRWKADKKAAQSGEQPILLLSKTGHLRPIEHEAESTLTLLDARFDVTRLLVLEDVRDHLQREPRQA